MKKATLVTTLSLLIFNLSATILILDNSSTAPSGVYTTFASAYAASSSGDTILIKGSAISANISYSTNQTNIQKEIHIIGEGYSPNNQLGNYYVRTTGFKFISGSSNSSIQGVEGIITIENTSNITISRCDGSVTIGASVTNVNIFNNILNGVSKNYLRNGVSGVVIANNIIKGEYAILSFPPTQTNGNIVIKNNLFISNGGFAINNTNFRVSNSTFINNVFYGANPNINNIESCTFSNNLSFNAGSSFPTSGTNSGGGNIINTDPLFVNESNSTFTNTDDYNYPSNSPLVNAGTDGTDIGIYGGQYPWPEGGASGSGFMYSQEPRLPQVDLLNVINGGVPQNGNLNVRIRAVKND